MVTSVSRERLEVLSKGERVTASLIQIRATENGRLREHVQELLDALPRCQTYGGEGPNGWGARCSDVAIIAHPTAVIGDLALKCAKHPGELVNEWGDTAYPTKWAALVERLVAQGFRSALASTEKP